MLDCDVVVIGAGPAGLCVAAELCRRGIDVMILERGASAKPGTRAIGVHAPTLEALEPSGATERILAHATRISRGVARTRNHTLGTVNLTLRPVRFPFVAAVPQAVTEAAVSVGAPEMLRDTEVASLSPQPDRVIVTTRHGRESVNFHARSVVIASGAAGRTLAMPFSRVHAHAYSDQYLMSDLPRAVGQPDDTAVITLDGGGVVESFPLPDGGRRLVAWNGRRASSSPQTPQTPRDVEPSHVLGEHLRAAVAERTNEQHMAEHVESAQQFEIRRVLLQRMHRGRVLVIGDAAHEVSPIGGQGMNLGLLDAAALAPVLARWLQDGEQARLELKRWEARRLAAARTAARIAHMNTFL
ncbi:MAG: FAD-dependent oxidoreductase, partial [Leucobacter sp.]